MYECTDDIMCYQYGNHGGAQVTYSSTPSEVQTPDPMLES